MFSKIKFFALGGVICSFLYANIFHRPIINSYCPPSKYVVFSNNSFHNFALEFDGTIYDISGKSSKTFLVNEDKTYLWKSTQLDGYLSYPTINTDTFYPNSEVTLISFSD
ncbi:hypothetical protein DKB58_01760 [Capnocytophaga canimorsus]|uniref:hypothetical protein n=1 Tax=Capnocytophaga canimorsus TaxID=28188 RepID=UPI000D6DE321|nr:hypothetical protein [Capnocytophaga canimorsus]AWL77774.1 hypothetical protein DKB58_01760 [Capnocytophaga canimorsus]